MAVDKILELDLSKLTEEGLAMIDEQLGSVEEQLKKVGKKPTTAKQKKRGKKLIEEETKKSDKKTKKKITDLEKDQKKTNTQIFEEFSAVQKSVNPAAILGQMKTAVPVLAPLFIATGLFTDAILKSDQIAKRFVDSADNRINLFVSLQEEALVANSLQQVIYTTTAGGTSPRDAYNSFNVFDRNVIEDGINSDLSDVGSLD